jgi:hypothetical protein
MNLGTVKEPRKWLWGRVMTRNENGFDIWTTGKIWVLLTFKKVKKKQTRNFLEWDTCSIAGFRVKRHPVFFAISLNYSYWR